jgi:hypothetical protein
VALRSSRSDWWWQVLFDKAQAVYSDPVIEHPPFREDQLLYVALKFAEDAGEPHPSLIQHAAGPHDRAVEIGSCGNRIPRDLTRCFLIAVRGSFVLHNASRPAGVEAPRGTVLRLYINAETGACMGRGLGDLFPDLDKLGPVMTDLSR